MNMLIRGLIAVTRPFSMRLGPCELNGIVIGVIVGAVFSALWYTAGPAHTPVAAPLWLQLALVLALFCWAVFFCLLCGPLRYAPSTVAGPLLVNAVVTSVLTIYLCNLSTVPSVFFLIGAFVGLAVGRLLCRFCRKPARTGKEG